MFNYYIYRSYFNARHSFNGDREKMHGHSFTIVTYIGMKEQSEDIPFFKLEAIVSAFIDQYRGKYLNELPEFQGCENTLETIGDYFYEELRQRLEKNGMELYQLDISENPLCVYQVSDRLLLPTMNMDTSNRNYQKIFDDILRLESMTGANNLQ